jgi:hypothetical protein
MDQHLDNCLTRHQSRPTIDDKRGGALMKTPWHIWVVGTLSLLWHSFGALDYTMSQTRNAAYFAMFDDQTRAGMLAYLDAYPFWASCAWAIGVWGAVLGSALILLRSRHAVSLLWLSMLGLIANTAQTFVFATSSLPILTDGNAKLFTLLIFFVLALVVAYAARQAKRGNLR